MGHASIPAPERSQDGDCGGRLAHTAGRPRNDHRVGTGRAMAVRDHPRAGLSHAAALRERVHPERAGAHAPMPAAESRNGGREGGAASANRESGISTPSSLGCGPHAGMLSTWAADVDVLRHALAVDKRQAPALARHSAYPSPDWLKQARCAAAHAVHRACWLPWSCFTKGCSLPWLSGPTSPGVCEQQCRHASWVAARRASSPGPTSLHPAPRATRRTATAPVSPRTATATTELASNQRPAGLRRSPPLRRMAHVANQALSHACAGHARPSACPEPAASCSASLARSSRRSSCRARLPPAAQPRPGWQPPRLCGDPRAGPPR